MIIDTDALAESLQAPVLKIGGVEYVGKIPSHPAALKLAQRVAAISTLSDDEALKVYEEMCVLSGWPTDKVLALPQPVLFAVVRNFFRCLRQHVATPEEKNLESNDNTDS